MVTDGKPTACFLEGEPSLSGLERGRVRAGRTSAASKREGASKDARGPQPGMPARQRRLYKNSTGGDPWVMEATFREVQACRKAGIMINTFMLASDYYLVEFVKEMTAMTNGKAYFANPSNLSQFVLIDFLRRRKSRVK
jgi:Ca-activated chloride channel family protein